MHWVEFSGFTITQIILKHSVHPPLFLLGELNLQPNFEKGGLGETSFFRGVAGKDRGDFLEDGGRVAIFR